MARKARTTEEAMEQLKTKHADKVALGRETAAEIARDYGTVTSNEVTDLLRDRGQIEEKDPCRWIGSVFNRCRRFKPTGDWTTYSDRLRNIHERRVRVWALA